MAGTLTGEIIIFLSLILSIFLMGTLAAVTKIRSNRSASKWAFKPNVSAVEMTSIGTPIDYLNNQTLPVAQIQPTFSEVKPTTNVLTNEFEVSQIEANEELLFNIEEIVSSIQESENIPSLDLTRAKEQAAFLVGDVVAEFITASLNNLPKGQAIIFGRFIQSSNEIEMNETSIKLSVTEALNLADGDLMLIKGQMLPNGEFRILHWDDADNVEAGYGHDDFVIHMVS